MGSPLDPVTGLPMVGVPDVVSQIPLGVQVVPWDDTLATDRPQGGPAYPNDIINTFAWVTGENVSQPGTVHAGTMTADRRLRVDTGSAGGGGVTPVVMNEYLTTVQAFTHGPSYELSTIPPIGNILYGFSVSVGWSEPMGAQYSGGVFRLWIGNDTTDEKVTLVYGQISDQSSATRSVNMPFNQTVMYPVPRDITAFVAGDPNNLFVAIENTQNLLEVQIALFTS